MPTRECVWWCKLGQVKYKGEEWKDEGYVLLFFDAPPSPQKESNRPIDMGKGTRNLNHLIYIPKIGLSYNF